MPIEEFWYGEEELLNVYIKAYFNGTKYNAWINGYYTYVAQLTATSNTWGGNDGKKVEYPQLDIEAKNKESKKIEYTDLSQFY